MTKRVFVWASSLVLLLGLGVAAADPDNLRQKQQAQEKARLLAGDLVSGVLDIQLRQLRENNLQQLPIYTEIESMRGSIDELVENEMQTVVQLLVQAQQGDPRQQLGYVNQARALIRQVVVVLMAERQMLLKRLQIARLAAQARQLVRMQTAAQLTTRSLPELGPDERGPTTLAVIEDQRDVAALFFQLVTTLEDVSTWGGSIAGGAAEGSRILKTAQVETELKNADALLADSDFAGAAVSQQAITKGLLALLKIIERTQGLIGADRETVLDMVRQIIKQQEELCERTRADDLKQDATKDDFAFQQRQIQQDVAALAEALNEYPSAELLVDQTRQAASRAEADLFQGDKTEALRQQGQVIGGLAEIEALLQQARDADISDQTADELAAEVRQLEQLDQLLDQAAATQAQATNQAAEEPRDAARSEQQVARRLEQAEPLGAFPRAIETRLDDARDAVQAAGEALAHDDEQAAAARQQPVERAQDALQRASSEVKFRLADTRRRQLAVQVGELARAAEALERAAAAEGELADISATAESNGVSAEPMAALAVEQVKIDRVAEQIAEGVRQTAPQVSQLLTQARPVREQVAQQLKAARENPAAVAAAKQTALAANRSAEQLRGAAAGLRRQAGDAARQLASLTEQQLQPVGEARRATQQALATAENEPPLTFADLVQALEKVEQARTVQLQAGGQQEAAVARRLARAVTAALRQQRVANRAAGELALGRARTPLDAVKHQQQVADMAGQISRPEAGELALVLEQAARSAAEAAKETLIGNPRDAQAARDAAETALVRASQIAGESAEDAAGQPPGAPDIEAQHRVGQLTAEARQLLAQQAAAANETLVAAERHSAAAEKALLSQLDAGPRQGETTQALAAAARHLTEALGGMRRQQTAELAEQARYAGRLAEQAATLDPAATAALRHAARAADNRTLQERSDQADLSRIRGTVQRGLQRAVASLAAREHELNRDKNIAETLALLAVEQQQARDEIASQALTLDEIADRRQAEENAAADSGSPPAADQLAAAAALEDATQRFAEAQRATGEGAVEISGQLEVANQPIRKGLETASTLGQAHRRPPTSGEPARGEAAKNSTAQTEPQLASEAGKPSADGEATTAEDSSKSAADKSQPATPATDQSGQPGQDARSSGAESRSKDLGTGFVPESPEFTAEQIAGAEALAQAAAALEQASGSLQSSSQRPADTPSETADGTPDPSQAASQSTAPSSAAGSVAVEAASADNQPTEEGALDTREAAKGDSRTEREDRDADVAARSFQQEPWFARLPPALQQALRARARRPAPRGYEERLKRYFESID